MYVGWKKVPQISSLPKTKIYEVPKTSTPPPLPHLMMSLDLFLLLIIISAKAETLLRFKLGHSHIYVLWNFSQSLPPSPLISKRFVFILILLVYVGPAQGGGAEKYVLLICMYNV